ncbi:MAG: hypothetical protein M3384_22335 [Acidobacteriota bacterium]|nr:hypothetical protein [Acidobacteriota bacterium]
MNKQLKIFSRNLSLSLLATAFLTLTFISGDARAQTVTQSKTQEEASKKAGQGVTFKIPDGMMPMQWSNFKGVLMLNGKLPAGIFISYPNENEAIEDLKVRAREFILPMFAHDKKDAKDKDIAWQIKDIPAHAGDREGAVAKMYLYQGEKQSVQISIYEREWNGLQFIYGYFSMKTAGREKDARKTWADDKGQKIEAFEKFWKTFPGR